MDFLEVMNIELTIKNDGQYIIILQFLLMVVEIQAMQKHMVVVYNLYTSFNGGLCNSNPSGTNNVNANPLFVDSGSGDFNLLYFSLYDAGDPIQN